MKFGNYNNKKTVILFTITEKAPRLEVSNTGTIVVQFTYYSNIYPNREANTTSYE